MRHRPLLVLALALAAQSCAPPENDWAPLTDFDASTLEAPHWRNGRFFNPWDPQPKEATTAFRWLFTRNTEPPPPADEAPTPRVENDGSSLRGDAARPEITWVGHSTFAIHERRDVVLTDPHFGNRALVVPRESEPGIPIEAVPADAMAVISHNHYDHLDAFTVDTLPDTVTWYVPLGLGDWFGARERRAVELDWWESDTQRGWTFTCLPSQHWSRRIGQGVNETLWCAWLIESPEHQYFFAGDSGYFGGFAEYGRRFPDIDVAMMPIGAYAPRWMMGYSHMTPAESLRAFAELGARYFLGMHWGTFDLTDEAQSAPPRALAEALPEGELGTRALVFDLGETWTLPSP